MLAAMATLCPKCGEDVLEWAKFCHVCGEPLQGKRREPMVREESQAVPQISGEYAPIWRRFLASVIDLSIVLLVVLPGVIAFFWLVEVTTNLLGMDREGGRFLAGIAAVLLGVIGNWLYHAKMQSSLRQATYGKLFMGLRVTGLSGERISFAQATGRHFAKFLSTFPLMMGFLIAPFTRRKQALHDMVAGTLVVRR
jgi:uncharacterized RDD family membrane protein YckC